MKLDPTQFCYLNFDIKARTQGVGGTYKLFCDKRFQGFLQCGLSISHIMDYCTGKMCRNVCAII